jgi:predicted NAD/FAD-binding protein
VSRIAVIGGGVAGLVAARSLASRAEVHVFEAADRPGGHAHTVTVDSRNGPLALDTGFLVFNEDRYPQFCSLLWQLGVASRESNMAFSVRAGDLEYGSATLRAVYAQPRNLFRLRHHRLFASILRFLRNARTDLRTGALDGLSLGEYLAMRDVSADLRERFVYPLTGALWSMGRASMPEFPASFYVGFLDHHGMLKPVMAPKWRTVVGGSRAYVDALLAEGRFELHLDSPVRDVVRHEGGVTIDTDGGTQYFDRVVLAVHADQALTLLRDADEMERTALAPIRFAANEVVLHTDDSFLPRTPAARASWNYDVQADGAVSVTYWLNRLQGIDSDIDYCVTLNPRTAIADHHVIRRIRSRHPLFDMQSMSAQLQVRRLQGHRRSYYCGAWLGFGFHEDGVRAGLAATSRVLADETRVAA